MRQSGGESCDCHVTPGRRRGERTTGVDRALIGSPLGECVCVCVCVWRGGGGGGGIEGAHNSSNPQLEVKTVLQTSPQYCDTIVDTLCQHNQRKFKSTL